MNNENSRVDVILNGIILYVSFLSTGMFCCPSFSHTVQYVQNIYNKQFIHVIQSIFHGFISYHREQHWNFNGHSTALVKLTLS